MFRDIKHPAIKSYKKLLMFYEYGVSGISHHIYFQHLDILQRISISLEQSLVAHANHFGLCKQLFFEGETPPLNGHYKLYDHAFAVITK